MANLAWPNRKFNIAPQLFKQAAREKWKWSHVKKPSNRIICEDSANLTACGLCGISVYLSVCAKTVIPLIQYPSFPPVLVHRAKPWLTAVPRRRSVMCVCVFGSGPAGPVSVINFSQADSHSGRPGENVRWYTDQSCHVCLSCLSAVSQVSVDLRCLGAATSPYIHHSCW